MSREALTRQVGSKLQKLLTQGEVMDIKIGYSTALIVRSMDKYFTVSVGNAEYASEELIEKINVSDIRSKTTLTKLFKARIADLEISNAGDLAIKFENPSVTLSTKVSVEAEAWEITGPEGFQIVSMPGGELAVWDEHKA